MRLGKKVIITIMVLWPGISSATGHATKLTLKSSVLHNGENISVDLMANDFGCKGKNIQPELSWQSSPEGTRSYAITLYDKDADTGSGFWHWMIIDIPTARNHLSQNEIPDGATIKANDTGNRSYLGPCSPVDKVHSYIYTLHALDVEKLDVPDNSTAPLTGYFINQHTLATSTLTLKVVRNQ